MGTSDVRIELKVGYRGAMDAQDLDELSRELSILFLELGVQPVERVYPREVPDGAKGAPVDWGTLIITLIQTGVITSIVTGIIAWMARDKRRTLELKLNDKQLTLTGISKQEQQELVEWFKTQSGLHLES